jgi:hypothetical protein
MLYMVTFTINIPQMLAYIPYMDPMGYNMFCEVWVLFFEDRPKCKMGTLAQWIEHEQRDMLVPSINKQT